MRLRWRSEALRQLQRIHASIARDNPSAAREIVRRIEAAANELTAYPHMGENAGRPNYRTRFVPHTNYRIFYRVFLAAGEVRIVRIRDVRRRPVPPVE